MIVMGLVMHAMMTLITTGLLTMKITACTSLTHVRKITIITAKGMLVNMTRKETAV